MKHFLTHQKEEPPKDVKPAADAPDAEKEKK